MKKTWAKNDNSEEGSSVYVRMYVWIHSRLEIKVTFPALVFAVAYPREEAA